MLLDFPSFYYCLHEAVWNPIAFGSVESNEMEDL